MSKKKYDDDDGRTVFDMSGVSRPSLFGRSRTGGSEETKSEKSKMRDDSISEVGADNRTPTVPCDSRTSDLPHTDPHCDEEDTGTPPASMTKDERKAFVSGALAAALLIALVFILGLGLLIFLLDMFWF